MILRNELLAKQIYSDDNKLIPYRCVLLLISLDKRLEELLSNNSRVTDRDAAVLKNKLRISEMISMDRRKDKRCVDFISCFRQEQRPLFRFEILLLV